MSLWKNTADAKSAPTWYARHAMFSGLNIADNQISNIKGTSFKTGDCVIYFSDSPITGLSNKGVYYVRCVDNKVKLFDTRAHANALTSEEGLKAISAASEAGSHLFIKHDRKETTNDGKEQPALIAVSKDTAALRAGGLVSPGWYRYFKYTDHSSTEHVHLELLAGVKTMVTSTPRYELSFGGVHGTDPNNLEDGWTNLSDNYLKIEITPSEAITDNVNLAITMKDSTSGDNLADLGFEFVDNETEESIEWVSNQLVKTVNFDNSEESVTLLWKINDGNLRDLTMDGVETIITATSTDSGNKTVDDLIDVYYTLYDLDFKTVSFNEGEEETHKGGWFEEDDVKGSIVSIVPTGTPGTITVKYKAENSEGMSFIEGGVTFSASHGDGAIPLEPDTEGYVSQMVETDGEEIKNVGFYIIGGGVSSDLGRCKMTLVCESTELHDATIEDHTYVDPKETTIDGVHGLSSFVESGWVTGEPNSLKFIIAPDGGVSYEDVKVSISLTDRQSGSSLEDLGFKFIDGDEGEMAWEDGKLTKTFSVEETIDPNNPLARLCTMSEGDLNSLGSYVDITMDITSPSFSETGIMNTITVTK